MALAAGLGLLLLRWQILARLVRGVSRRRFDRSLLFQLTLSLDENTQQIYLMHVLNRLLEGLIVLLMVSGISRRLGFSAGWTGLAGGVGLSGGLIYLSSRMKRGQDELLSRLQRFLFFYEMALMRGDHQYLALREADQRTGLFDHYQTVADYIEAFNQLYGYLPWMAIKKLAILLERNQFFSNEDLTLDFVELAQELHQRYAQTEKIKLERRENLMLIPMSLNLLLMIGYLIAPFIRELI